MSVVVRGLAGLKGLAGSELEPSRWLTMSQDRIQTFADATGDHQWIHVDVERARTGPFGGTIAHGYLTLAIIIPLWTEMVQIEGIGMAINYGLNRVRFPAPVPAGSRVRLRAEVDSVVEVAGGSGVQLDANFTVEVAGGEKPAAIAQALYRYYE